jgi:methylase of polypeptide subunit release factors
MDPFGRRDSLNDIRAHQAAYLDDLKKKKEPYFVRIKNIDIKILPGVFPPATDTYLFADHINVYRGDKVLDLTTGSGALAVIAGTQSASGIACDINKKAVENARENFQAFHVDFEIIESDLFKNIPVQQFDYIFANGPYIEGEIKESLEYAFYGARDFIERLFRDAGKYLSPDGKILITFAEWGENDYLKNVIARYNFQFDVLGEKSSSDGKRVYIMYEVKRITV